MQHASPMQFFEELCQFRTADIADVGEAQTQKHDLFFTFRARVCERSTLCIAGCVVVGALVC
jgi:hypothetical protein